MAKILLAWELGANLGHLGPLSLLGRELRTREHEPVFVVRSLKYADELLGRHRLRYLQGPVWPIAAESKSPALNYSEILQRAGFLDHHQEKGVIIRKKGSGLEISVFTLS